MKWIKCSDKLPTKDMKVFVYCTTIDIRKWGFQRSKYITDEYWHNGDKQFCLYEKEWRDRKARYKTIITHWMKFPEPPKEQNDKKHDDNI